MQSSKPIAWLPGAVLSQYLHFICPEGFETANPAQWRTLGMAAYWSVYMLAMAWLKLVTNNVPGPYLDEIFHIPQAQLYCNGTYDYWDPKLTTPPGLYIFATIFTKLRYGEWDVFGLRLFNATVLPVTMLYALSCRHLISIPRGGAIRSISPDSIHTALNITLFPPLFFFSGLFYTDLLSTCVVLATYRLFLRDSNSSAWMIYPAGLVALTMRQTNIFWVAIFLGGLEIVRTVSSTPGTHKGDRLPPGPWKDRVQFELGRWGRGEIHDVPLSAAGVHDYIFCGISIAVAILNRPIRVMVKLAPYIALLVSFGGFVLWNGGVVLGDKSNHVATIHLTQLLYLFAFTAFFSLPLIMTPIIIFLQSLLALLQLPIFPRLKWQYVLASTYCIGALIATLLVIKYNTIIHPFTLADNRHYVFYVFRYTILRRPIIRYLLGPIYLACGWAVYLTICGPSTMPPATLKEVTSTISNKPSSKLGATPEFELARNSMDEGGPKTSFLLILLLTTTLSLITAPLVEPRYFIIPWVMWRLHVPSFLPQKNASQKQRTQSSKTSSRNPQGVGRASGWLKHWAYQAHDYRLWMETLYFLVITTLTGYVFLYRGFEWIQEPGNVQRFMW